MNKITNFLELHNALNKYLNDYSWVFRGQAELSWDLIPKAFRKPHNGINDENKFKSFKRRAIGYIDKNYNLNDWDWLAIAQHHGLATRLLDWSFNPLVAAYFAVKENCNKDAVIYAYYNTKNVVNITKKQSPFYVDKIMKVKPVGISKRIIQQSGIFTIHTLNEQSLKNNISKDCKLEEIIIDKSYKKELLCELSYYGINSMTLFPDLDGLCSYMNWSIETIN